MVGEDSGNRILATNCAAIRQELPRLFFDILHRDSTFYTGLRHSTPGFDMIRQFSTGGGFGNRVESCRIVSSDIEICRSVSVGVAALGGRGRAARSGASKNRRAGRIPGVRNQNIQGTFSGKTGGSFYIGSPHLIRARVGKNSGVYSNFRVGFFPELAC